MSEIPQDKSPESRFIRLAEKRVTKAIMAINSVAKLSDRKNYRYSGEQVEQLLGALEDAMTNLRMEFATNVRAARKGFEFKDVGEQP